MRIRVAIVMGVAMAMSTGPAAAGTIVANCTGMIEDNVYRFDTDLTTQEIAGIGTGEVSIDDTEIRFEGAFGEYRFDREIGTEYLNERDTGNFCTFKVLDE